ncbi:hypothetical protein GmRootV15_05830 [Variovorax sp. V15]
MVRVLNLFASGEGSGPMAIGASPSSSRWISPTSSVSPISTRHDGRPGRPGGSDGEEEGATSVGIGKWSGAPARRFTKDHLGKLPPVQPV